jgi:hypothetical protein
VTGAVPHSGTTFEIFGSVGVALAVIVVCLVAERLPAVTFPFAAVGAMAFTVYTGQAVAVWLLGTLEYVDNITWLTFILASLAFATAWRLILGRGLHERLLTWSFNRAARVDLATPCPRETVLFVVPHRLLKHRDAPADLGPL